MAYHRLVNFGEVQKAIKRGDVLFVRHALASGLDPNLTHRFGSTILMLAAHVGNTAIGRELVSHGAHLDIQDKHGWSALCTAIHMGHGGFVKFLIDSGASIDLACEGGSIESFVDWAVMYSGAREAIQQMRPMIEAARTARKCRS